MKIRFFVSNREVSINEIDRNVQYVKHFYKKGRLFKKEFFFYKNIQYVSYFEKASSFLIEQHLKNYPNIMSIFYNWYKKTKEECFSSSFQKYDNNGELYLVSKTIENEKGLILKEISYDLEDWNKVVSIEKFVWGNERDLLYSFRYISNLDKILIFDFKKGMNIQKEELDEIKNKDFYLDKNR